MGYEVDECDIRVLSCDLLAGELSGSSEKSPTFMVQYRNPKKHLKYDKTSFNLNLHQFKEQSMSKLKYVDASSGATISSAVFCSFFFVNLD